MEIVGALARGNKQATIYFVEYSHSSIERQAIQNLVDKMRYNTAVLGNKIKLLALECSSVCQSEEEVKEVLMAYPRLVGMIFENETNGFLKTIILDEYIDLDIYLREFLQEDDLPPTPEEFLFDDNAEVRRANA
jgi:hypothetical protein